MKKYICIDVGGTEIKYGIISEDGDFLKQSRTSTEAEKGGPYLVEKIETIISQELNTDSAISGIGISSAGMVDSRQGKIIYANSNIPNYTGTEIKKCLENKFHLPCEVENDVCCAGIAEYICGAAQRSSPVLCLTVGTGIGGCILVDGKVVHGYSCCAGSIGYFHMPDQKRFEEIGSASALVQKVAAQKKQQAAEWNGKRIFAEAMAQDEICIQAIDEMVDVLGLGIANATYLLNPEVIVLGGGIMRQEEYLLPRIQKALEKYLIPVIASKTKLRVAIHYNEAGMLGAFYHFKNRQGIDRADNG